MKSLYESVNLLDDQRPRSIEAVGSEEFFAVVRRANAGEFKVNAVLVLGNARWKFMLSYDPKGATQ